MLPDVLGDLWRKSRRLPTIEGKGLANLYGHIQRGEDGELTVKKNLPDIGPTPDDIEKGSLEEFLWRQQERRRIFVEEVEVIRFDWWIRRGPLVDKLERLQKYLDHQQALLDKSTEGIWQQVQDLMVMVDLAAKRLQELVREIAAGGGPKVDRKDRNKRKKKVGRGRYYYNALTSHAMHAPEGFKHKAEELVRRVSHATSDQGEDPGGPPVERQSTGGSQPGGSQPSASRLRQASTQRSSGTRSGRMSPVPPAEPEPEAEHQTLSARTNSPSHRSRSEQCSARDPFRKPLRTSFTKNPSIKNFEATVSMTQYGPPQPGGSPGDGLEPTGCESLDSRQVVAKATRREAEYGTASQSSLRSLRSMSSRASSDGSFFTDEEMAEKQSSAASGQERRSSGLRRRRRYIGSQAEQELDLVQDVSIRSTATSRSGHSRKKSVLSSKLHSFYLTKSESEHNRLVHFVTHKYVETMSMLVIIAHAVVMGAVANHEAQHGTDNEPWFYQYGDTVFWIWYILELALKLAAFRCNFFTNQEWKWNWFDVVCVFPWQVLTALLEQSGGGSNFSFLRVLRLCRVARIVRAVRLMRMFRELRVMLYMTVGSLKTLFWTLVMFGLLMYMFSIIFVFGLKGYLAQHGSPEPDAEEELVRKYWGGILLSMKTMYMAVTSGVDWMDASEALWHVGSEYYLLHTLFIGIVTFGIINVLLGMYCQGAAYVEEKDRKVTLEEELQRHDSLVMGVSDVFHSIDVDNSNVISWDEFETLSEHPKVHNFLTWVHLDPMSARQLFRAVAGSAEGGAEIDRLLAICPHVQGSCPRRTLMSLKRDTEVYMRQMRCLMLFVEDNMCKLHSKVKVLEAAAKQNKVLALVHRLRIAHLSC